ncbi:MAG: SDR family oxidoreductase [Chloroflexi bacterium]|nr:SDR family oxidoreductase [Chloroflexota bacterium]
MRLANKVAIVAGVGPGIGRHSALTFAREGAAVALVARTKSRLDEVAAEIRAHGGKALAVPCDMADEAQVQAMMRQVHEAFGRIDVLMNNGTYSGGLFAVKDLTIKEWNEVLHGALTSYLLLCREALKYMIPQRSGSIVNVSSGAGKQGFRNRGAYGAAKAGVNNLTHTLAFEVGRQGIRVNAIVVGAVKGEAVAQGALDRAQAAGMTIEELQARWGKRSPLGRMVLPQEAANLALFLASDESSGMTGQLINMTAGVIQH